MRIVDVVFVASLCGGHKPIPKIRIVLPEVAHVSVSDPLDDNIRRVNAERLSLSKLAKLKKFRS